MIFQILAPHFCAGGEIDSRGRVTVAAPIIKYMRGWHESSVILYCTKNQWTYRVTETHQCPSSQPTT